MSLLQRLINCAGLQPQFNYFDPVKGVKKGPKHLHPNPGDSFSSGAIDLGDLETGILEQLMPIADSIGPDLEFLLPSLLQKGILVFSPPEDVQPGSVQRYGMTDVKQYESEGIKYVVTAKAIGNSPNTHQVLYLLNSNVPSKNKSNGNILQTWLRSNPLPPYPPNFKMPKAIVEKWISYESSTAGRKMTYPILAGNEQDTFLRKGDQFNAILMAYTPESKHKDFRIFQFTEFGNIGYAKGDNKFAVDRVINTFPYDQLHPNLIYRFEITGFDRNRPHIFFARPLIVDFREGNNSPYANTVYNLTKVRHHIHRR